MRISYWSSDVCSSDLDANLIPASLRAYLPTSFSMLTDPAVRSRYNENFVVHEMQKFDGFFSNLVASHSPRSSARPVSVSRTTIFWSPRPVQIGRETCRERVCQNV